MPKYCGSLPEVGQKQKTEKERKKDLKLVITMASYALQTPPWVAHASRLGQQINIFCCPSTLVLLATKHV